MIKLSDINEVIEKLNVIATELDFYDSVVVKNAVEVIEYLVKNQKGVQPEETDLKEVVMHLVTTLRDVSMALAANTQLPVV